MFGRCGRAKWFLFGETFVLRRVLGGSQTRPYRRRPYIRGARAVHERPLRGGGAFAGWCVGCLGDGVGGVGVTYWVLFIGWISCLVLLLVVLRVLWRGMGRFCCLSGLWARCFLGECWR